jgi:hypothetical protein
MDHSTDDIFDAADVCFVCFTWYTSHLKPEPEVFLEEAQWIEDTCKSTIK